MMMPTLSSLRFAAATRAVAGGNLAHRVTVETDDELGQLGQSFNATTDGPFLGGPKAAVAVQKNHDGADPDTKGSEGQKDE